MVYLLGKDRYRSGVRRSGGGVLFTGQSPDEGEDTMSNQTYPQQAESPIIALWEEHPELAEEGAQGVARAVLGALGESGWRISPPRAMEGVCKSCGWFISPGTRHTPYNGNQLNMCSVLQEEGAVGMTRIKRPTLW